MDQDQRQRPTRCLQRRPTVDPAELQEWKSKAKSRVLPAESLQDGTWLLTVAEENFQACTSMCHSQPRCPPRPLTWASCCSGSEGVRFCTEAINKIYEGQSGWAKTLIHKFSCENNTDKQNWIAAVDRHADGTMNRISEVFEARRAGSTQAPITEEDDDDDGGEPHDCDEHEMSSSSSSSRSKVAGGQDPKDDNDCSGTKDAASEKDAVSDVDMDESPDEPICIFRSIMDMGCAEAECVAHKKKCPIPTVDILVVGIYQNETRKA